MSICNNARARKASAIDRIGAMLRQEDESVQCYNYLARASEEVDEEARASMQKWIRQVAAAMTLDAETGWIATFYLDRYLSSGKGRSEEALQDKYLFQLAAIAAFYLAVKLHSRVKLDAASLARLCRGYYPEEDITDTEEDILFALDWRTSTPTPFDFVREYVELLPEHIDRQAKEAITESTLKYIEGAADDYYITFYKPSVVGAACLCSALLSSDVLDAKARLAFWMTLAEHCDLIEVMEVENKILEGKTLCKPIVVYDDIIEEASHEAAPPVDTIVIETPIAKSRWSWPKLYIGSELSKSENTNASVVSTWPKMAKSPLADALSKSESNAGPALTWPKMACSPLSNSERSERSQASLVLATHTARQA
ncbi:hypothetical protein ACHAXT_003959 [Thalassiosira profunda]